MITPRPDDLAEACRRGDARAFEDLYRAHADGVYHVAFRVLCNQEDAHDAVQETFLTAFRRMVTFRGEGSLHAWMLKIATRTAFRIRRRRRHGRSLDAGEAAPVAVPPEPARDGDFQAAVARAIERLPERSRLVFQMHTVENMTHAEIGAALGIDEGTSKSQLSYARSLLRERLQRWCRELS